MAINGIYIVHGELTQVVMGLRKARRWSGPNPQSDEHDPLLRSFADLRDVLATISDLSDMAPSVFLSPFLEVIKCEHTSGIVSGIALSAVSKFLSYGLIDPTVLTASGAVEQIAMAVTHARFVGTDPGSDEVILFKILQVLRVLMLNPVGSLLSNDAVCEILQSCFRICFETRLSELLRRAAESTLSDMIQLMFTRLPTFEEDLNHPYLRRLKMRAYSNHESGRKRKRYKHNKPKELQEHGDIVAEKPAGGEVFPDDNEPKSESLNVGGQSPDSNSEDVAPTMTVDSGTSDSPNADNINDATGQQEGQSTSVHQRKPSENVVDVHESLIATEAITSDPETPIQSDTEFPDSREQIARSPQEEGVDHGDESPDHHADEGPPLTVSNASPVHKNTRGVEFINEPKKPAGDRGIAAHVPYGLPSLRELFRFLISLVNPNEPQNSDQMIQMGLNLLTVSLEAGADYLGSYSLLLPLVKNQLARNLLQLLATEKLQLFAATLRACFLLFESLRTHMKLQLETYLQRLMDIVTSENPNTSFEQKETALEALVQLWRIPGLVTELYLNYDCHLYCSNIFEDLTKLLSKNAFPVVGLYSTHLLSLDALLTVVDTIEANCHYRTIRGREEVQAEAKAVEARESVSGMSLPPISGYAVAMKMTGADSDSPFSSAHWLSLMQVQQARPNRMPIKAENLPTHEELIGKKQRKRILATGTELFNQKPQKGISFLQENGLLSEEFNPEEVSLWLRENPKLSKEQIGEYVSARKNETIREAFVRSFNFKDVRIDDALRQFLEAFRLPKEAPLITFLLESFASHYHISIGEQFAHPDAAFTLAYGIIMLNVDQHNVNAKRQNIPMTVDDFKRNLKGVNGGENFDQELLEDIYWAIRGDEIIMPAEQTGLVKENYLWKVMLHRSNGPDGQFIHAPSGVYDHDLFSLCWSPTVAAISYVLDKTNEETVVQKSLSGFRKCAAVAAHYGMSDVMDNLIISLCKFSTILSQSQGTIIPPAHPEILAMQFGQQSKAQMAAKLMFQLVHFHGDILRDGWKNIVDCLLQLYYAKLLPKSLTETEDFVDPKGWISIQRDCPAKDMRREESGILSSVFSYLGGSSSDRQDGRSHTAEDQEHVQMAISVIQECKPEQLVTDSRYLTSDSLSELLKTVVAIPLTSVQLEPGGLEAGYNAAVFLLEFMCAFSLENKDRLGPYWRIIKGHLFTLLTTQDAEFLVERSVVCLIRLVTRLLSREELAEEMLQSLSLLLLLSTSKLKSLSVQLANGLHQLIRSNAANIHAKEDWALLFNLLDVAGAAAFPKDTSPGKSSLMASREFTSDSELYEHSKRQLANSGSGGSGSVAGSEAKGGSAEWQYVEHADGGEVVMKSVPTSPAQADSYWLAGVQEALVLRDELQLHQPKAFLKCCETLSFLVRDTAHITPENFESCVRTIRTFIEAATNGGRYEPLDPSMNPQHPSNDTLGRKSKQNKKQRQEIAKELQEAAEENTRRLSDNYHQASLQLLDLAHTLHVKGANIFQKWKLAMPYLDSSPAALWFICWCPLLQSIARLCCDSRRQVRVAALNYLPRALLIPDLQTLQPVQWEECFSMVLFPLLVKLQENFAPLDPSGTEEAKVRAVALLCKVFLQHLSPLSSLADFASLWTLIIDFLGQFYRSDSDLLNEAVPESLKNLLLVMDTAGVFATSPHLYQLTAQHLQPFLPHLMTELFPHGVTNPNSPRVPIVIPKQQQPEPPAPNHPVVSPVAGASPASIAQPVAVTEAMASSVVETDAISTGPAETREAVTIVPEDVDLEEVIVQPVIPKITTPAHKRYQSPQRQTGLYFQPENAAASQIVLHPPSDSVPPKRPGETTVE